MKIATCSSKPFYVGCLICLLTMLTAFASLHAQTNISGILIDSSKTSLPGANVVLLNASDSILVGFGSTDNQGRFRIDGVAAGDYLLRCSFLGHKRPEQRITVNENDQLLNLGDLVMYPEGYLLEGIEVNGYRIPIRMRGDTMVFDADAFGTGPNAVVEDLLRRLPGMTIDNSGRILFRGKPVNELMVNGKPFFRGNTQLVTQNLDAAAVQNVEVFDQKSDTEIVSGQDDGQEDITVNLEIKEEAKGKFFGQLYAGAGTAERYQGGGKAFRISDRSQLGALGLFNNLNRTGFQPSTALGWDTGGGVSFGGAQDGQLPVSWRGQTQGDNRTLSGGFNFGSSIGKRSNFAAAYILLDRNQQLNESYTDVFSNDLAGREVRANQIANYKAYSHRLSLDFDTKADTISSFKADLALFITGQDNDQQTSGRITETNTEAVNYRQLDAYQEEAPGLSSRISYNRRMGGIGRTLSFEQRNRIGRPESSQNSEITGFANLELPGFGSNGNSNLSFEEQRFSSYSKLSYVEPLSKRLQWKNAITYDWQTSKTNTQLLLGDNNIDKLELKNRQGKLGLHSSFRRAIKKGKYVSIGAKLLALNWQLEGSIDKKRQYQWLVPDFQLSLGKQQSRLFLFFSANPEIPANHQLQAIADPQQVSSIRLGNPSLEPALNYGLNGFYSISNQFSGFSFNLNANANYIDNVIGEDLSFLEGRQLFQPRNLSHEWRQNANLRVDQRLDFLDASIGLDGNIRKTNGAGSLNGVNLEASNTNLSLGVQAVKNLNAESFLRLEYRWGKTKGLFNDDQKTAIVTSYQNMSAVAQLEFSPKWRLESDFGFTVFSNELFPSDGELLLWNATLELRPFKKAPHYFTIMAQDLLDQNRSVSRNAYAFFTRSSETNSLGRFFLLSFHYKL